MIDRRRVAVLSYINSFFSQSYINYYATGQSKDVVCSKNEPFPEKKDDNNFRLLYLQ